MLTATTARQVTFSTKDPHTKLNTGTRTYPAGTTVYAQVRRDQQLEVRVPGTRYTQTVHPETIRIP